MPFTKEQKILIEKITKDILRKKLQNYKPETSHMPFHYRLLGRDRMALFSFIHSLNTTLIELRPEFDDYFSQFK